MSIRITQSPQAGQTTIKFVLDDQIHNGPVSVVGTFNEWTPGTHRLVRRSNGTRSVSVAVPHGQEIRFRYLGSGGAWFDDPDAHAFCSEGSLLRL
jgi:1,4-alpha-glucan branching enzyme